MHIPMAQSTDTQYIPRAGHCEFLEIDENELDTSCLHVRLIKSPTKDTLLFGQSCRTTPSSDPSLDSVNLLSDLSRLAPSVAKGFMPKDRAESSLTFRLINDVDFHAEETGYIAMSYCRKRASGNTPQRVVTPVGDLPFGWTKEIEQFPLPTSSAVFQAVLHERGPGEGLWFDQVCISQDNETEIMTAVGAIDTVYKNARTVVVVLDDVTVAPAEEKFLRYYVEQYNSFELSPEQEPNIGMSPPFMRRNALFRSFFQRVIDSTWFERAWCAHEMRTGKDHVFLVPCYTDCESEEQIVIRFTGTFFLHMLFLAGEIHTTEPEYYVKLQSFQDFFLGRKCMTGRSARSLEKPDTPQTPCPQPTSLIRTTAEIFQMKAGGNPRLPEHLRILDANRDKTCIVVNASTLPLALAPVNKFSRPNTEDECMRSLLLVGLAARDPVALCTTGTPLQLHDGSTSWLSRPIPLDVNPSHPPPPRFSKRAAHQITQGTDGKAEYLQLDLIFLDLPHRSQPTPLFPGHAVRARMFVDLCIHHRLQASALWNF